MKKLYLIMLCAICLGVQQAAAQTPQKPLSFDDLSKLEYYTLNEAVKSPDFAYKVYVDITGNSLPAGFTKLQNVQMLALRGNLRGLDWKKTVAELNKFKNLRYVFLFDSFMSVIPAEIFTMKQLVGFGLSESSLSKIPPAIAQLSNLEYLYLDANRIKVIPAEITQLKKLKLLILDDNSISVFPAQMAGMKNLEELRVVGNPVKAEEIKKLKKTLPKLKIVEEYNFPAPPLE